MARRGGATAPAAPATAGGPTKTGGPFYDQIKKKIITIK